MNPFSTPDAIYISKRPQDMRAGMQRLAAIVAADFGRDPMDGALYCFVSRDCEKMKLLVFDSLISKERGCGQFPGPPMRRNPGSFCTRSGSSSPETA